MSRFQKFLDKGENRSILLTVGARRPSKMSLHPDKIFAVLSVAAYVGFLFYARAHWDPTGFGWAAMLGLNAVVAMFVAFEVRCG